MTFGNRLELHYYFTDSGHEIDALIHNKCEAEILAIVLEAAAILDVDANIVTEAYLQGGFRDIWKFVNQNSSGLTVLLLIVQIIISAATSFDKEGSDLEKELNKLSIEEKKLQIEKLKKELKEDNKEAQDIGRAADAVGRNLKIIKRKSNFYSYLEKYPKVKEVGFAVLSDGLTPISEETVVHRSDFSKFVLSTNKLRSEEDDNAEIEIISPVLREGRFKWKGIYKENVISFEMQDTAFRDSVIFDNVSFQNGTKITCVLVMHRELDEVGDVKIIGYSVTTVIEKIDGDKSIQTVQGKKYLHAKKLAESQSDLFTKTHG